MDFSTNLRNARVTAGMSMTDLAERCSIAAPQIAKYENGITVPNIMTAKLIARALGVTIDELVNDQNETDKEE